MAEFRHWTSWGPTLVWTLVTLTVSWGIGLTVGAVMASRLPISVPEGHRDVARDLLRMLRTRVPWWSLLIGAWLAAGFWPLTPDGRLLADRLVLVLGALSVTLAIAAMATRAIDAYGGLAVLLEVGWTTPAI
jgi:hypothetical protein